jgi:hypothetical protein
MVRDDDHVEPVGELRDDAVLFRGKELLDREEHHAARAGVEQGLQLDALERLRRIPADELGAADDQALVPAPVVDRDDA